MRDDDPNFCHLGLEFSETGKSIREREREKHHNHKPSRAKRLKAKKSAKKENRERTTETESYLVRAGSRNDDSSGRDGKHFLLIISDG